MAGIEHFQLVHFGFQIGVFDNHGVAGGQRLDLVVGQHRVVDLLHDTGGGFGGKHL